MGQAGRRFAELSESECVGLQSELTRIPLVRIVVARTAQCYYRDPRVVRSLGLERYEATFAREDVSVQTLVRMTDDDLAALGLPKGPRVQILAWASR